MTTSQYNLAAKRDLPGYSAGYMQGFRDGNSGLYGDTITDELLRRLEQQWGDNENYRTGYIEGFKDSIGKSRVSGTYNMFEGILMAYCNVVCILIVYYNIVWYLGGIL